MHYDFSTYTINDLALALDSTVMQFDWAYADYEHAKRDLAIAEQRLARAKVGSEAWCHLRDAVKDAQKAMLDADIDGGRVVSYQSYVLGALLDQLPYQASPKLAGLVEHLAHTELFQVTRGWH